MFTPQSSVPTSEPQIGGFDYLYVHYARMQGIFFQPHLHTRQSLQQPRGQHQVNTCSSRKYFRTVDNFLHNYKDAHTGIRMPFIKAIPMGINSPIAKFSNGSSHFIFLSVAGLSQLHRQGSSLPLQEMRLRNFQPSALQLLLCHYSAPASRKEGDRKGGLSCPVVVGSSAAESFLWQQH